MQKERQNITLATPNELLGLGNDSSITNNVTHKKERPGTSLVVQWLRLHTPNEGSPGLTPGQGIRSHIPQLRAHVPQLKIPNVATKIPHATTKTQRSQINK